MTPAAAVHLHLLNDFEVRAGAGPVELPIGAQRLVAFVALRERPVQRDYAAAMLWLDGTDARAGANLRSTLWRIQKRVRGLLEAHGTQLRLGPGVEVDLRIAEELAHRELQRAAGDDDPCDPALFSYDLLPDWYDDWLTLERERFRQLRMSALESLCERLTRAGRLDEALEAGLRSLASEPLRESGHRALIRVHLAAGNAVEALRQYSLCRRLLREQLGIEPTQRLRDLFDELDSKTTGLGTLV